ncbi:Ribosomal RNA small subunit methyltransferase H [Chlamydiales bacterium STE3]|nr:Ribosomal RNA small subunit methyltransferase H [Chlamydiales bacterium STE3]
MNAHQSVLLDECLNIFKDKPLKTFVDGTLGAGGHAEAFLKQHPELQQFVGVDQDEIALKIASKRLAPYEEKTLFFHKNFAEIEEILTLANVKHVEGILVDLGVSSMQLDMPEKGFSFLRDGPLDMRMDQRQTLTAEEIVNSWGERDLGHILKVYGEEKKWRKVVQVIIRERKLKPIKTTLELVALLDPVLREPIWLKKSKIHPLTRTFQAIRIAVNQELRKLEQFLAASLKVLSPGGRLAVITFHSLEDRIVKHFFKDAESDKISTSGIGGMFLDKIPEAVVLTRKPVEPSTEEMEMNPRSRSAKLRAIEKL